MTKEELDRQLRRVVVVEPGPRFHVIDPPDLIPDGACAVDGEEVCGELSLLGHRCVKAKGHRSDHWGYLKVVASR